MRRPLSPSCLISRGSIRAPRNSVAVISHLGLKRKALAQTIVLSIVPQRFFNRFGSNLPMRSVPDGLAVSQDDYLRRFVLNTGAYADLAGKIAGALDLDQGDLSLKILHLPVCARTYRTGCAVFEND